MECTTAGVSKKAIEGAKLKREKADTADSKLLWNMTVIGAHNPVLYYGYVLADEHKVRHLSSLDARFGHRVTRRHACPLC